MRHYLLHVFGIPTLLASLGLIGLISALLADGLGDLLSWLTLGSQVAVIAFCWLRPTNDIGNPTRDRHQRHGG